MSGAPSAHLARWQSDFFDDYYRRRPVNATFIGMHEHDVLLPDLSVDGLLTLGTATDTLLQRLHGLPAEPRSAAQAIDRRLSEGFLTLQQWELAAHQTVRGNPCWISGEAVFGVLSLFLRDFAPFDQRLQAATERMQAIPVFLAGARDGIGKIPTPWAGLAMTECRAAMRFFDDDAPGIPGAQAPAEYRLAAAAASQAFEQFGDWLEDGAARAPDAAVGCGAEALAMHLERAHCIDESAGELLDYAKAEIDIAHRYLDTHCADFGATTRDEVLDSLAALHATVDQYYDRYDETWKAMRQLAIDRRVLTWPDFPIRYVPRPGWSDGIANDLYFLSYRSPPASRRPPVHDYFVTPIGHDLPAAEQVSRLRTNNDSAIKLNHVVHHGGIGHHVQNWHAFRADSEIGRMAAVDCASRIAMHCGGTMAEGWACYATDLMAEMGGLTDAECYAEQHTRVRMCARAIVDLNLHSGCMSFADAVAFYRQEGGMSGSAAVYETTRNSMYPGMAVMYLAGTDTIHRLRRQCRERDGGNFDLCKFHDRFLSHGSIPVRLIAESMLAGENAPVVTRTAE